MNPSYFADCQIPQEFTAWHQDFNYDSLVYYVLLTSVRLSFFIGFLSPFRRSFDATLLYLLTLAWNLIYIVRVLPSLRFLPVLSRNFRLKACHIEYVNWPWSVTSRPVSREALVGRRRGICRPKPTVLRIALLLKSRRRIASIGSNLGRLYVFLNLRCTP
jgi:hypothetical protein